MYGSFTQASRPLSNDQAISKYSTSTLFSGSEQDLNEYNATSTAFSPLDGLALLAAKPEWQPLGSGWEGSTFKWNGNVVKAFNPERSPFRNCLAPSLSQHGMFNDSEELWRAARWPTEIPASVVAGAEPGFLPIKDFFLCLHHRNRKPNGIW